MRRTEAGARSTRDCSRDAAIAAFGEWCRRWGWRYRSTEVPKYRSTEVPRIPVLTPRNRATLNRMHRITGAATPPLGTPSGGSAAGRIDRPHPTIEAEPSLPMTNEPVVTHSLGLRRPATSVIAECLRVQATIPKNTAVQRFFGVSPLGREAQPWYVGALGELEVARRLGALGPGWYVLHSVPVGYRLERPRPRRDRACGRVHDQHEAPPRAERVGRRAAHPGERAAHRPPAECGVRGEARPRSCFRSPPACSWT